jgi:hypothetical protein
LVFLCWLFFVLGFVMSRKFAERFEDQGSLYISAVRHRVRRLDPAILTPPKHDHSAPFLSHLGHTVRLAW